MAIGVFMIDWYVVHTYSGFEGKVREHILKKADSLGLQEKIPEIVIPTEEVVELRGGKKRKSSRKFFPGYILIRMEMNDETWHIVNSTPKVTGFLGGGNRPMPLKEGEMQEVLHQMDTGTVRAAAKGHFEKGEVVRIVDGPFVNFNGVVDDVNPDQGRLRVMVSIFGRATPVELEYLQVEKEK
jgi:transcriptional antiterminator NusG